MMVKQANGNRKKMLDIKVPDDFLRDALEAFRELMDNTDNEEIIEACQKHITRIRKYRRMGEPRNREMRKMFDYKVKEHSKWGW